MGLAAIDQGCATDLILMDLGLPGITGDEATARLKANPSTRNIPVVINTAFNVGAYTNRALDAGAVEILHKPLELQRCRM
jgi:CheY-like chemotaxis protein